VPTLVRVLRQEQVEGVAELGDEFMRSTGMPGRFNASHFIETWTRLVQNPIFAIFSLVQGFQTIGSIGGIVYDENFTGDAVAAEQFWFVTKSCRGHGLRLLDAFEKWARENGAKRILMAHINSPESIRSAVVYKRRKYRELETLFVKEL